MFPLRKTLLGLTLGLAAWIGWLHDPVPPGAESARDGRSIKPSQVHQGQAHTGSHRPHPARPQKTRPDPTPEESHPLSVHLDDPGPGVVQGTSTSSAMSCLTDTPSLAWSEPAGSNPLLLITHRFRC
jgi:hypothetical protein